jgi:hypothetical protein
MFITSAEVSGRTDETGTAGGGRGSVVVAIGDGGSRDVRVFRCGAVSLSISACSSARRACSCLRSFAIRAACTSLCIRSSCSVSASLDIRSHSVLDIFIVSGVGTVVEDAVRLL